MMDAMKELLTEKIQSCIDSGQVTIADLSRESGCSRQHIYNFLSGKSELTVSLAERLANACGLCLKIGKLPKVRV